MPVIKKYIVAPYTSHQIYTLVANVERYPEFLKWCQRSTNHSLSENEVEATLWIAYLGMHYPFTTKNTLKNDQFILMKLIDGPFRFLEGEWHFKNLAKGCDITFELAYEFSTPWFSVLLSPIFHSIANTLVTAFIEEAHQLYDKSVKKSTKK